MFFESWPILGRTVIVAACAYIALLIALRVSGKRTLSKWNAFDFIVTIALGSSLAAAMMDQNVTVAEASVGFAVLVGLQFLVTWLSVRIPFVQRFVKATPALLLRDGVYVRDIMKRERVTEEEIRATLRENGIPSSEAVAAVVLETDGSFSVIRDWGDREPSALADVRGFPGHEATRQ